MAWGGHHKLQIDKLGLWVYSTGASVLNFIEIRVELADIYDLIKMAPLRHGVVTPNCKKTSWDHRFVGQEPKYKVSYRSELN